MEKSNNFNKVKESYYCLITESKVIVCRPGDATGMSKASYTKLDVEGISSESSDKSLVLNLIDPYLMIALIEKGISFDVVSHVLDLVEKGSYKKDLVSRLSSVQNELWSCCAELKEQNEGLCLFNRDIVELKASWADIEYTKRNLIKLNE